MGVCSQRLSCLSEKGGNRIAFLSRVARGDVWTLRLERHRQGDGEGSKAEREVDADDALQASDVLTDVVVRHYALHTDANPIAMPPNAASATMMPAACIQSAR